MKNGLLNVSLAACAIYFLFPTIGAHSSALATSALTIAVMTYPLMIWHSNRTRATIIGKSARWFALWSSIIILIDMANPNKIYEFGPVALLFTIPISLALGSLLGVVVSSFFPDHNRNSD